MKNVLIEKRWKNIEVSQSSFIDETVCNYF